MTRGRAGGGLSAAALALLLCLLPFEPRRPLLHVGGLGVTALEALAGAVIVVLLAQGRHGIAPLVRRRPAPLIAIAGFALACLLSAAAAEDYRGFSVRFAMRMVVGAVFAFAVAVAPREARRRGLAALATGALAVALLGMLEVGGLRGLDRLLDHFRESYVLVGNSRRATAGSEHPNLAGACAMYGLLAGVALASGWARWRTAVGAFSFAVGVGLFLTYSRGAALAALGGLLAQALARGAPARGAPALLAAGTLLGVGATFAWQGPAFALRAMGRDDVGTWYRARVEPGARPLSLSPGERRDLPVKVTNTGRLAWEGAGAFLLGYHWRELGSKSLSDGFAAPLSLRLAPGESATLTATLQAPELEGSYALTWDMVHTQVGWFSRSGDTLEAIPVRISHDPDPTPPESTAAAPLPPVDWRPDRAALWRAALTMWAEHPLLGIGPDNFRRLLGRHAGRTAWDSRTHANNAFLEVAATTGALGLLAFAATLLATAAASWRLASEAAGDPGERVVGAALFSLSVGVALHGLVDYVLAFTGHYLLLGFVVGASASDAAPPRPWR